MPWHAMKKTPNPLEHNLISSDKADVSARDSSKPGVGFFLLEVDHRIPLKKPVNEGNIRVSKLTEVPKVVDFDLRPNNGKPLDSLDMLFGTGGKR